MQTHNGLGEVYILKFGHGKHNAQFFSFDVLVFYYFPLFSLNQISGFCGGLGFVKCLTFEIMGFLIANKKWKRNGEATFGKLVVV